MKQAFLFFLLTLPVMAQVSFTGADYVQNFDGMGTGTAAPAGWEFYGALGGNSTTWTTTIPASGIGGGTLNSTLTASTTFSAFEQHGGVELRFARNADGSCARHLADQRARPGAAAAADK
jgi:hypothetical protein